MTVSMRVGYVNTKNLRKAKESIKNGFLKAAGVTPNGDVVIETMSESSRKISHLIIDSECRVVTHFCERIKKLHSEGTAVEGTCWHLGAILMAYSEAYPGTDVPIPPQKLEIAACFPEAVVVVKDITPQLTGKRGEFNRCQLIPIDMPADNKPEETYEPATEMPALSEEDAWLNELNLPVAVLAKVVKFREGQRLDLTEDQFKRIPENVNYTAQGKELVQAIAALMYGPQGENWEPVLLRGPKGTGKSTLVNKAAEVLMLPVNRISGSTDHDLDGLLGGKTLRDGEVVYEEGLLLRAVTGGELLILDEVNVIRPDITAAIHPLLEHRNRSLAVPGLGYIDPPPTFRAIACMNLGYMGTTPMNEAFKDRFRPINVPYATTEVVAGIIVMESGCTAEVAVRLAKVFEELKSRANSDDPIEEDVLSMRNLIRAAKEIVDNPEEEIYIATSNLSEGIDDEYTRKIVADVVATIYGERA